MLLELYVNLEAAGKTELAHEAKLGQFSISCFMQASGHTLEVNVFVQSLWLKTKSGRTFEGGRIFEKLRYICNAILVYTLVFL